MRLTGEGIWGPPKEPDTALAVLRASNGQTVEVVGSVLVGRAPARDRARTPDAALLTVTSPSHDISRTHLEVSASGWDVVVTDLHSTNGTYVDGDPVTRALPVGPGTAIRIGKTVMELEA